MQSPVDEQAVVDGGSTVANATNEPPPADDGLQALLDEFDRANAQQTDPVQNTANATNALGDALDQQTWEDLLGPNPRIAELEGELSSVRQQELDRQSRSDFEGFAKKLQADLGNPNVPDDFARTTLLAMSVERPELQVAWQYRHLTNEQRAAADLEFRQLEALYFKAQQAPDDPRKQQALAQMEARGRELGLMMNAQKILNGVWRDVQRRAEKAPPPVDLEQTQIHADVAFAVRNARAPVNMVEPPPELGKMDDQTFRKWKLENLGWE
jgi:hypothetical protein